MMNHRPLDPDPPPSVQQERSPLGSVSQPSTNTEPIPVPRSHSSLSTSSTESMKFDATVPEIPREVFHFKLKVQGGRGGEITQTMKEHIGAPDYEVQQLPVAEEFFSSLFDIYVKWDKGPENLLWDAVATLLTIGSHCRLIFDDRSLFRANWSDIMTVPLNSLHVGSMDPDGTFESRWTTAQYKEPDLNYWAEFDFNEEILIINCWDEAGKAVLLPHKLMEIDLAQILKVYVNPLIFDGKIKMILKIESPVTVKSDADEKIDADDDFAASKPIDVANEITNTMNQEDLSGKLADCRHIKLNMKLSKEELYKFLTNIYDVTEVPVVFQLPQIPKPRMEAMDQHRQGSEDDADSNDDDDFFED